MEPGASGPSPAFGPSPYAAPRLGLRLDQCSFYHTMEIPGAGVVQGWEGGNWDLRGREQEILRGVDLAGSRILEVGPASGFLTFEMERRGAEVVSVDAPKDHKWDIVPFPGIIEKWQHASYNSWDSLTNAWWFAHEHYRSRAKMCYVAANKLDTVPLGRFDVAMFSNVLLHMRDPLLALQLAASMTDREIVVVEMEASDLEPLDMPLAYFNPDPNPVPGQENWNAWWRFSSRYFHNALSVMGFKDVVINRYQLPWRGREWNYFTLVARRPNS